MSVLIGLFGVATTEIISFYGIRATVPRPVWALIRKGRSSRSQWAMQTFVDLLVYKDIAAGIALLGSYIVGSLFPLYLCMLMGTQDGR